MLNCLPDLTKCNCIGHRMPGVYHAVACCDQPHVSFKHNHITRDIKPKGECEACDYRGF